MPSGTRIRGNNAFGVISDNPLTAAATVLNSPDLPSLPAVSSGHAIITLDPLREYGNPEIIVVTAHTASSTVATITRGAYGTTARQHPAGTVWVHAPIDEDVIEIATSGARPSDPYRGQMIFESDTNKYVGRSTNDTWIDVVGLGAWVDYVPVWTQSTVVTKTVGWAKYTRIGRLIVATFDLTATGGGTPGAFIGISLPVPAAMNGTVGQAPEIGGVMYYDANLTTRYNGTAEIISTTVFQISTSINSPTGFGIAPAITTAAGDIIRGTITYEAAS